jgi:DNA-binding MarR family transcriptional regulator
VTQLTDNDYASLLAYRTQLRRFDHWSEQQARRVGLTHMQHQLLLAVRGHADPTGPTIGDIADYLMLRHHSAVELANRVEAGGWVTRRRDGRDARVVRLALTDKGRAAVASLGELHLHELQRFARVSDPLIAELA